MFSSFTPTTIVMKFIHVFTLGHYFHIFYSVICFVTVYMMDYFFSGKFSSKIGLHYLSVLKNSFSIYIYSKIPQTQSRLIPLSIKITLSPPTLVMGIAKNLRGVISRFSPASFNRTNFHITNDTKQEIICQTT